MLFLGRRNIEVSEYSRASVTGFRTPPAAIGNHTQLDFSGWRLAIAIGRTICSRHLNMIEFWFDILASVFNVTNLIENRLGNVRLNSGRMQRLRDFSRKSRVGEMGQGLVWMYLSDNGYPFISDYEFLSNKIGITIPYATSTPDFVVQSNTLTNNICLVEAKGTETDDQWHIKRKLKGALGQCDSGELLLNGSIYNVIKKIGFCSLLLNENSTQNSQMYFTDPEVEVARLQYNDLPLRLHFASWFYLVGDFLNVTNIIERKRIDINEKTYSRVSYNNIEYWVLNKIPYQLKQLLDDTIPIISSFFYLGKWNPNFKIGIADTVVQALQKERIADGVFPAFLISSADNHEIFSDGTIVFDLKNKND